MKKALIVKTSEGLDIYASVKAHITCPKCGHKNDYTSLPAKGYENVLGEDGKAYDIHCYKCDWQSQLIFECAEKPFLGE